MRVHTSNFVVMGFTESASLAELVALGHKHNLPVIDDIGSGPLLDLARYGLTGEPLAGESIQSGADLVLFSGDKLLGGPQCGVIAGRKRLVDEILQHPMMRALRVGKLTLAALAATLRLYQDPQTAEQSIPLFSLLATPLENLRNRAERLAPQMAAVAAIASAEPIQGVAFLGGGSVPTQELPTWCVALAPSRGSVSELAASLRAADPAIVGRIQQDRLLLDLRCVPPKQDCQLVAAVEALDKTDRRHKELGGDEPKA
jgi:L-seryl-tRNA(Ser) seleniumtransferase